MSIYHTLVDLDKQNKSYTVATVIRTSGSVPGKVGFKLVVSEDKKVYGTVGGGELELTAINEGLGRLNKNESGIQEYELTAGSYSKSEDNVTQLPMSCEGKATIYFEVHKQKPTVYVFGGGHVGGALLYMMAPLNYHTILVDNRTEIATRDHHPHASEIVYSDYLEYAERFEPPGKSFIVILTQGHQFDYDILSAMYRRHLQVEYIGIIASKSKAFTMLKNLKNEFGEEVDTEKLSTPVGLKIGGNTASEIALSIAAEIQSVRYNKILIPE